MLLITVSSVPHTGQAQRMYFPSSSLSLGNPYKLMVPVKQILFLTRPLYLKALCPFWDLGCLRPPVTHYCSFLDSSPLASPSILLPSKGSSLATSYSYMTLLGAILFIIILIIKFIEGILLNNNM